MKLELLNASIRVFAASQAGQYPCMDAEEVKIKPAHYEKKEGECDRCRLKMIRIVGTSASSTYWCPMCGAVQKATYHNSVLNNLGDCALEFKYPEMTAYLPFDNI